MYQHHLHRVDWRVTTGMMYLLVSHDSAPLILFYHKE